MLQTASFSAEPQGDTLTFRFSGRLDTAASAALQDSLLTQVQGAANSSIVFDLAGTDFVSSMFLRLCIMSAKAVGQARFRIVGAVPAVHTVFAIAGLDQHFGMT